MNRLKLIALIVFLFATICLTNGASKYSVKLNPLPEEGDYKASGTVYKKGGMEPLFDFARSFIHTSLPGEFPNDFIKHVMNGPLNLEEVKSQLLHNFLGFVAAIVIGFLFIIFFPLIGCCFCCCRCCGKSGAKSNHEFSGSANCHRLVLSSALFVVATFALVGNICTYVSNERMTTGLKEINSNAVNNLDDIDTFLNLTEEQVNVLGPKNLNITWKAVITTMDTTKLSNTLSDYIIETLSGGALATMEANIQKAETVFDEVEHAILGLRAIYTLCPLCNTLETHFTLITQKKSVFTGFKNMGINTKIKDQIATQVQSKLSSINLQGITTDVNTQFEKMYKQFDIVVTKIRDLRQNTQSGFNVASYKGELNEYSDMALKYNNYRWIAGSVLSAILTLIISFLMLGIVFGVLGNTSKSLPVSRGCVSHTGSRMLMVSVVFIFIFSSLLMLLTTASFTVGAPLERYVCQGLDGPNYPLLKVLDDQSFLTKMGIKATISDVVRSCKEGKTAYVAFQLENSTTMGFNMKKIQSDINVNKQAINAKLDTTLQSLSSLDTSHMHLDGQLNLLSSLVSSLTGLNFTLMKTALNLMKQTVGGSNGQILTAIDKLNVALNHFDDLGKEVAGWQQNMIDSITYAQSQLSAPKMQQLVTNFSHDVFGIVDRYIEFAFDASFLSLFYSSFFESLLVTCARGRVIDILNYKLGKCTPLWNLYNSLLLVSFCKYTIDAFNGFWFSIGWCIFFFMPGIILAVILEKYFRRMNTVGVVEDSTSFTFGTMETILRADSVMEMKHNA